MELVLFGLFFVFGGIFSRLELLLNILVEEREHYFELSFVVVVRVQDTFVDCLVFFLPCFWFPVSWVILIVLCVWLFLLMDLIIAFGEIEAEVAALLVL